jgi:ubiquinone/menaquinone biosynthesis C-methylase UbiE
MECRMTAEPAASDPGPAVPAGETYTQHNNAAFDTAMTRRTSASDAGFFLPHLRPGMRLLDVGCGPGSITLGLAAAVAPGEVIGLDLRPDVLAAATALAQQRGVTTVRFQVGDVYALPFPDAAFDAVFASQVLVHLRDPLAALKECRRVLTPSGVAGIRDQDLALNLRLPDTPLLEEMYALFKRVVTFNGANPYYARHLRRHLLDAGFARTEATATLISRGSAEATRELVRYFLVVYAGIAEVATAQGWVTPATVARMYEELRAWGERPDALWVSGPIVEAIGWVSA